MSSAISIDRARHERRERQPHPVLGLIVQLVAARARRRIIWLDALREHGSGTDDPDTEQRFYAEQQSLASTNERIAELEQACNQSEPNPLQGIAALFDLTRPELDLFKTCLAPALEPAIGELYGRLHGHPDRRHATEPLAARLFGWGRRTLWNPAGGLATWGLIEAVDVGPGQTRPLFVDPHVLACMQGEISVDAELVGLAAMIPAKSPLEGWPVAQVCTRVEASLEHGYPLRFIVMGPAACGRRSLAAAVAQRLGMGALAVDCDDIDDERWPSIYVRVVRLALMANVIPVWHGERVDRRWPKIVAPPPVQFVVCEDPSKLRAQIGAVDERIVVPSPSLDERRALWRRMVPSCAAWTDEARERLAVRHRLSVGDIAEIGRRMPTDATAAASHAREHTRGRLGELGQLLDCPFGWDDLVLADRVRETLEDFTFEASERAVFWEAPGPRRLFPRGTGLVALLTGPPGTGKTMAAQVVAAELELDLFRINLATVISKYIGETAKNLDTIFSRAARMNAVLLFDEADALFSKRTEVKDSHDRYANTDTNYLLQLLEDYRGIALLASNKKNNIDAAFIRRIRYVLDFARPDGKQRWIIWRKILGELLGAESLRQLEPAVAVLAETVDISGAQIKNSVLAAVFVARRRREPLSIEHLICGIDRELGKEGRAINDRERERLRRHG
jgi:hypothetical protein